MKYDYSQSWKKIPPTINEISDQFIHMLLQNEEFDVLGSELDQHQALTTTSNFIYKPTQSKNIVSIVGGAASGKTTFARSLAALLGLNKLHVQVICTDDYSIGTRQYRKNHIGEDTPLEKYNFELLYRVVEQVKKLNHGQIVTVPVYNPQNGAGVPVDSFTEQHIPKQEGFRSRDIVGPVDIIIVEGDFQPLPPQVVDHILYFHVSDRIRFKNRLQRDLNERSYFSKDAIVESFALRQKHQHIQYTLPVAKTANTLMWAHWANSDLESQYSYDLFARVSH